MNLERFKKDIELELETKILNANTPTPILDRLQTHLDTLENKFDLYSQMLNPKNLENEMYLSMLYQIIYPAKKRVEFKIYLDDEEIIGKTGREKIMKLVKIIGSEKIKKLKRYNKFLNKKEIGEAVGNAYKIIDEKYSFDTSFGGVGASSMGKYFINELKQQLNLNVKYTINETFSYN